MLVRDILNKKGNKVFTSSPDTLIGEIANTLVKENALVKEIDRR